MIQRTSTKRRAFSLVELLIAMGVLTILITMLFLGGRSLLTGNKKAATKTTLAVLKGMLDEFDAKTKLATGPQQWMWFTDLGQQMINQTTYPSNNFDFWKSPYTSQSKSYRKPDALDAPPSVVGEDQGQEGYIVRNASRQVMNTQAAMQLLMGMPNNRAAMEKMPPEHQFTPQWCGGKITEPSVEGVQYRTTSLGSESAFYLPGAKVQYQGKKYICINLIGVAVAGQQQSQPGATDFKEDNSPATPLLLDAWNNPIILVPGTGLRVRLLNGKKENEPGDPLQTFIIISPEGKTGPDPAGTGNQSVLKVGRPFWASAGPDGDFAKGDDNVYSFEQ